MSVRHGSGNPRPPTPRFRRFQARFRRKRGVGRMTRDLSANRVVFAPEKRSRVRRFCRSSCEPKPFFRCNPDSVRRRPPLEPLEERRTDFRSRKFTNFRTLLSPDPAVSRLSSTKVHELSDEKANAPDSPRDTARPAPRREPADAVQVACAKARARLASQDGPKEEAIDLVVMVDD